LISYEKQTEEIAIPLIIEDCLELSSKG